MTASRPVGCYSLEEIVARFGGELIGPGSVTVRQVAPLDTAEPDELSFLTGGKYRRLLESTRAGAVILGRADRDSTEHPRIVSDNPYAYLARVSALFNPGDPVAPGIDPAASVHPSATIAASAAIGPCATVDAGASIGERCVIGAGSAIGRNAVVGDDTRLYAHVVIYRECRVGARCILHSGVVIGADGFGIAEEDGRWIKVPQIGRTLIGDDVEIGANSTVDRGALGDTVIEEGVKLDNLIQIAHNVVIGAHTAIAACAGIAGSARIGRGCRIGGAAMIHGHIEICDGAVVGAGTMVRKNIREPGVYDGFFPSLPHREWMKNLAHFNRLHELADTVRELQARMAAMEGKSK
ncbi:MAG: UDP-3-O-(3-hydroxymyristoyl)glucosamine N-acyltransferase [Betaproteobacteria bacterium]